MGTPPILVLDFTNKRAMQLALGENDGRRELAQAVEQSRRLTTAFVGASPPQRADEAQ